MKSLLLSHRWGIGVAALLVLAALGAHAAADPPGTITGHVTTDTGFPPVGYCVQLQPMSGWAPGPPPSAPIAPDGSYTLQGPPGTWAVLFTDCTGGGFYLPEFYADVPIRLESVPQNAGATPVTLASGGVRANVDAVLTRGGRVRGTVTDRTTGDPLANICVAPEEGHEYLALTTTAPDGSFDLLGPAGSRPLFFHDCNNEQRHLDAYYPETPDPSGAQAVAFVAGGITSGIQQRLSLGASIAGTVTQAGGAPVENACVTASSGVSADSRTTAPDGSYRLLLAAAGSYKIQFLDCRDTPTLGGQWYPGVDGPAEATALPIGEGTSLAGIDAVLHPAPAGSISGRIVSPAGVPFAQLCVASLIPRQPEMPPIASVDPQGRWAMPAVGSGQYFLAYFGCDVNDPFAPIPDPVDPGTTHGPAFYLDRPLGDTEPLTAGATPVTVRPGQNTTVDACLGGCDTTTSITSSPNPSAEGEAVTFTARVAAPAGTPTGSVAFEDGGSSLGAAPLDGSGRATLTTTALSAGSHAVRAVFGGSPGNAMSVSAPLTQTVGADSGTTQTTLVSSANPTLQRRPVTFTATVTSAAGTPRGSVEFRSGGAVLGTARVEEGRARITTSFRKLGSHPVTATYSGSEDLAASSGSVVQRILTPRALGAIHRQARRAAQRPPG